MTIEKTTEILQELWRYKQTDKYTESEIRLALDIAIQTLKKRPRFILHSDGKIEQIIEPCDNAVRKKAVLEVLNKYGKFIFVTDNPKYTDMVDEVANLPSVIPKREQGEWIFEEVGIRTQVLKCSKCGTIIHRGENFTQEEFKKYINDILREKCITLDNFCHNCGAEMAESEAVE